MPAIPFKRYQQMQAKDQITDPKEDKAVAHRNVKKQQATADQRAGGARQDPRAFVNTKSLVRAGKKLAFETAQTASGAVIRKLRQVAGMATKAAGRGWGPVMLAEELLVSKETGGDQYGRQLDSKQGFQNAILDDQVVSKWTDEGQPPFDLMEKYGKKLNQNYIADKVAHIQQKRSMESGATRRSYQGSPINASFERLRQAKQSADLVRQELDQA